jgi:hypothetical protein
MEGQELFYFISSFFQAAKKKNREKIRKFWEAFTFKCQELN